MKFLYMEIWVERKISLLTVRKEWRNLLVPARSLGILHKL